ncbi:DUF6624 domain-containing protein, partial [Streptomyces sp. NPDC006996]|uniref:DUF6624 domain-containing protein n=1 Tax=Streptomyces sp. NPDC006996 TaxID=3156908 RepID=UPI0033FD344C
PTPYGRGIQNDRTNDHAGPPRTPAGNSATESNRHQQEYGTQLLLRADGIELCPLRAPESVDERRADVGLPPIAVALESVRRRYTSDRHAEEAPAVVLARAA